MYVATVIKVSLENTTCYAYKKYCKVDKLIHQDCQISALEIAEDLEEIIITDNFLK